MDIVRPLLHSQANIWSSGCSFALLINGPRHFRGIPVPSAHSPSTSGKPARHLCFSVFAKGLNPHRKNRRHPINTAHRGLPPYWKARQYKENFAGYSSNTEDLFTHVYTLEIYSRRTVRGKGETAHVDTEDIQPSSPRQDRSYSESTHRRHPGILNA
jgi:hypothetical protein